MTDKIFSLFATTAKGLEDLLALEIQELGIEDFKQAKAGVYFNGTAEQALTMCMWSRIANRVLLQIAQFDAPTEDDLYAEIQQINWQDYIKPTQTFAIDCSVSHSQINHNKYAALKTKDAIVDQFRDDTGDRPNVETDQPDVRLNLYIHNDKASLSLDLSGDSLHKRGYRIEGEHAPLKENLAAAILMRCQWPKRAKDGEALVDPMCGSGTLIIEAAMMAADIAPGIIRDYYGFTSWQYFDESLWEKIKKDALQRREAGLKTLSSITGYDASRHAVKAAEVNLRAIGLLPHVHVEKRDISEANVRKQDDKGILIVNPPYGVRLSNKDEVNELYELLGHQFQKEFKGWDASVFTDSLELGKSIPLRAHKIHTLYNGALECKLLHFHIDPKFYFDTHRKFRVIEEDQRSENAKMFANRLKKNIKHLRKWAKRENINAYRLYDADLPEYALAIDIYACSNVNPDINHDIFLNVQEYEAPSTIDSKTAERRLNEALSIAVECLDIKQENLFIKQRKQQKGSKQYEKLDSDPDMKIVEEAGHKFYVNFSNYLDTGLFLDHRVTRKMIEEFAKDTHFLNLFSYTSSVSVYAAKGGALSTTSVDMSNTYLDWSAKNFELNGIFGENHEFIRANCIEWLKIQRKKFDLIFLDPPSFSNSKKMEDDFNIQDDHIDLIRQTMELLSPDGILIFSNNYRKFKLDSKNFKDYIVENITEKTIPLDFKRNQKIHHCWMFSRKPR